MSPRRSGAHAPRHAPAGKARRARGVALVAAGGMAALAGAVLFAGGGAPAGAEAGSTTATLTLLGIRDSNCDVQTGGTTAYVAPGGTVKFKGELAGISVKLPVLGTVPISSSAITSFNYKLIVGGDKKHPHYVNGTKTFTLKNIGSDKSLSWTANSVQANIPLLGLLGNVIGHKLETIPLNGNAVGLPAGGKLAWAGKIVASKDTKCGIAQVPGGEISVGPITVSVPPITNLPSQPGNGISIPNLPTGGGSSSHPSNGGGGGGSHSPKPTKSNTGTASGLPTTIPELVVPHPGGGDSAFGGGVVAQPDAGGGASFGPIAPAAITSTAPAPASSSASKASAPKPVDLADNSTDSGIGGAELPVVLAIVAIIALALVTATYARMYLLRKPPTA